MLLVAVSILALLRVRAMTIDFDGPGITGI